MTNLFKNTTLYVIAVLLCLFTVWYNQFPPMQDYPTHLFLSQTLATFNEPQYNWAENYIQNPQITPYSITHRFIAFLTKYINLQSSGKVAISVYILLVGYVSITHSNTHAKTPIWSGILLFPLIFNQTYYLGFLNFLISIPLLMISLQQHISISRTKPSKPCTLLHLTTLITLFLIHPYTFLVFITSSLFLQLTAHYNTQTKQRQTLTPILSLILFSLWLTSNISPNNILNESGSNVIWLPLANTLTFYLMLFSNSSPINTTSLIPLICCSTILVVIAPLIIKNFNTLLRTEFFQLFLITSIGFLTLPFYVGDYSYLNLRLAPISLFFLVLSLFKLDFSKQQTLTLSICSILLIFHTSYMHYLISIEKEDIIPMITEITPNSSLIPLYLDGTSAYLHNKVYLDFNVHDHNYYHIHVGGGVSPNITPNKMFPILSRSNISSNSPKLNDYNYWKSVAPMYEYVLVRHGNKHPTPELPTQFHSIKKNRTWELFINTSINK